MFDLEEARHLKDELGFWPATTDSEDIERHRRLNAAIDAAPSRDHLIRKWSHLRGGRNEC